MVNDSNRMNRHNPFVQTHRVRGAQTVRIGHTNPMRTQKAVFPSPRRVSCVSTVRVGRTLASVYRVTSRPLISLRMLFTRVVTSTKRF